MGIILIFFYMGLKVPWVGVVIKHPWAWVETATFDRQKHETLVAFNVKARNVCNLWAISVPLLFEPANPANYSAGFITAEL
jgi:hypothetical protein